MVLGYSNYHYRDKIFTVPSSLPNSLKMSSVSINYRFKPKYGSKEMETCNIRKIIHIHESSRNNVMN